MLICPVIGLGSFQIGYLQMIVNQEPRISHLLGIPADHGVYGFIAFGYPEYTFNKWIERRPAKVTWI